MSACVCGGCYYHYCYYYTNKYTNSICPCDSLSKKYMFESGCTLYTCCYTLLQIYIYCQFHVTTNSAFTQVFRKKAINQRLVSRKFILWTKNGLGLNNWSRNTYGVKHSLLTLTILAHITIRTETVVVVGFLFRWITVSEVVARDIATWISHWKIYTIATMSIIKYHIFLRITWFKGCLPFILCRKTSL